jgi:hypothetical protein
MVDIITGGGLPSFLGAPCTGGVFSAPVVTVSMSMVMRGAKKLRVNSAFGSTLTSADVGASFVDFLAVCEVLIRDMPLASFYFMEVFVLGR